MTTRYDEIRLHIKDMLDVCYKVSLQLLDDDISGYDDMREGYGLDIVSKIDSLRKEIF